MDFLNELGKLNDENITVIREYIDLLSDTIQNNQHHRGNSMLNHTLKVVGVLLNVLSFFELNEKKNYFDIVSLIQSENKFEHLFRSYLNQEIEGVKKKDLLIYSAMFHDIGKIYLLGKYSSDIKGFKYLDYHHFFSFHMIGTFDYCKNNIEDQISNFEEKLNNNALNKKNENKLRSQISYLRIIIQFLEDHKNLIDKIQLTNDQLNFIKMVVHDHHTISKSDYLGFKRNKNLSKGLIKKIRKLKKKGIYEAVLLLYYSDTMSCIHENASEMVDYHKFIKELFELI